MTPEQKLADLGLVLPAPTQTPAGLHLPFVPVNIQVPLFHAAKAHVLDFEKIIGAVF